MNIFAKVAEKIYACVFRFKIIILSYKEYNSNQYYCIWDLHPFLGMYDGREHVACLLTETGDAGSSPHVAKVFFSMMFHEK